MFFGALDLLLQLFLPVPPIKEIGQRISDGHPVEFVGPVSVVSN
jgi:hypothetical protein